MFGTDCSVEYRPVEGFPGYFVGDDGSVWSTKRPPNGEIARRLKFIPQRKGDAIYWNVGLYRDGKLHMRPVHQVVAAAWHGPCPVGLECRHLDGKSQNNIPGNLKWGTHQENMQDMVLHQSVARGEDSGVSVINEEQARRAIELYRESKCTVKSVSDRLNLSRGAVRGIISGRTWTHLGTVPSVNDPAGIGSRHFAAKLTEESVVEMRNRFAAGGVTIDQLAREYGVSDSVIGNALCGATWKHCGGTLHVKCLDLRGENQPNSKLTDENVLTIRKAFADGVPRNELSELYGVSPDNIWQIVTGKTWTHIGGPTYVSDKDNNRGEKSKSAKLSEQSVLDIRQARHGGRPTKELAKQYGVSEDMIRLIVTNKAWTHVGGPIQPLNKTVVEAWKHRKAKQTESQNAI